MLLPCFLGRFSFDEKFRFEFLEISSDEWNSIFRNLQKRRQPCNCRKFQLKLTFLIEFSRFSGKWFTLQKFNKFQIFFPWKFP